ncbi:MAG: hypothetical protein LIO69_00175 [Oscillospiraceae bacterium]|nr:hypothetical protein [Oscillospiraceae bacterium]
MKIYIEDSAVTADIFLYNVEGEECSDLYFGKHYKEYGFIKLSENYRFIHNTEALYCLKCKADYDMLAETLNKWQITLNNLSDFMDNYNLTADEIFDINLI